ncbi:MAG: efflux RND transporter periplasmic adaptor subunit [Elusimicrobiota bacterium]
MLDKSGIKDIPSVKYFLKIVGKLKPPDRFLTFSYIRNFTIAYIVLLAPLVAYSIYKVKQMPPPGEGEGEATEATAFMPMVKVIKVNRGDFNDALSVNGTVKGTSEVELKFEISGKIASFNFREGDFVSKGENIISLDSEDVMTRLRHAKTKLQSADSRYGAAKEKLNVYRDLYDMGAIIKAKLNEMELSVDGLKSEVDTAKAEVDMAQSVLEKTVITSAEDGVMGAKKVEVSDYVSPTDIVGTFLEVKNVFVEMGVIEKDIKKVLIGQKVKVKVDAYAETIFWGRVDNISQMIIGETRTLPVKVIISNPGQKLISGMYADCEIFLAEFTNKIIIPVSSVINLGKMVVVPIVKTTDGITGVVELRKIETEYSSPSYTVVEDGLESKDLVVMETQQPLKDGMNVKIIEVIELNIDD